MTIQKTMAGKRQPAADPDGGTAGVAAVNRALSILCCFSNGDESLSLAELAARTGLYKSTILRMTESLEQFNVLVRDQDNGFRLGYELVRLGALARRVAGNKVDIEKILSELAAETGESATYYIRRNDFRLALFRVDSAKSLRDHIRPGDLLVLGKGAAGRVLQDMRPSHERGANPWEAVVSLGERDPEIAAIAGPVFKGNRVAGSISISGSRTRFTQPAVQRNAALVETACRKLSLMLDAEGLTESIKLER